MQTKANPQTKAGTAFALTEYSPSLETVQKPMPIPDESKGEASLLPEFVWDKGTRTLLRLNFADNKYYPVALPEIDVEFDGVEKERIAESEAEYHATLRKVLLLFCACAAGYVVLRIGYKLAESLCVAIATQFLPALGTALSVAGEYLGYTLVIVLGGYLLHFLLRSKPKATLQDFAADTETKPAGDNRTVHINVSLGDNAAQAMANQYRP
jgi:hypothetical protein